MATKQKAAAVAGKPQTRRLTVNATIKVKFSGNFQANLSKEEMARELEILIRGTAATAAIEDISVKETETTGKRAYMAGITKRNSDEWAFQGIVVAKDKDTAKLVLSAYKKDKFPDAGRCEVELPFFEDKGVPTFEKEGVYDTTYFGSLA